MTTESIPKGYKKTEIGVIPEDWEIANFEKIGPVCSCKRILKNQTSSFGDIPFYKIGTFGKEADAFISKKLYQEFKQKYSFPKKGSILISASGTIGRTIIYDGHPAYFQDSNIIWIKNNENKVKNLFLFYYYKIIEWTTEDTTISRLYNDNLKKILIYFPKSKQEQRLIATALSETDELIQKLDELISKKKNIKKGAMQELLTGKKRLPGFSGEWEEKALSEIVDFMKGTGLSKTKVSIDGKNECLLYGELFTTYNEVIKDIVSKTNYTEGTLSKYRDILMPGSTTTIGIDLAIASAILKDNIYIGGDVNILRRKDNSIDSKFLANYITHVKKYEIAKITQGTTIIHLYGGNLKNIRINIPPTKQEQSAIASILSDMDFEIEKLEEIRDKYQMIKKGMMQQLLTGRIRLKW